MNSSTAPQPIFQNPKLKLSPKKTNPKPTINVSKIVKETCSVYISKGRINNTASKLIATKKNCVRIAKELAILEKRFNIR